MMSIHIAEISDLELIAETERSIPEFTAPYSLEKLTSRLEGRRSLCLVARNSEDEVLGYKVGYAETSKRFYSWVGGVKPEARKQGVARKLLHYQEGWCQRNGFEQIQVWSENRYRGMLIFLLREGYDIFALSTQGSIEFRKRFGSGPDDSWILD